MIDSSDPGPAPGRALTTTNDGYGPPEADDPVDYRWVPVRRKPRLALPALALEDSLRAMEPALPAPRAVPQRRPGERPGIR